MFVYFDYSKGILKKIRNTNIIERCFKEVRRRTRPISCFENNASCSSIIFGVISHLNNYWKDKPIKRIYTKNLTLSAHALTLMGL
ncbi:MAG: transposase [Actinobacteria bacterium]|nr:transposase [Actinomycetota bacterium]